MAFLAPLIIEAIADDEIPLWSPYDFGDYDVDRPWKLDWVDDKPDFDAFQGNNTTNAAPCNLEDENERVEDDINASNASSDAC